MRGLCPSDVAVHHACTILVSCTYSCSCSFAKTGFRKIRRGPCFLKLRQKRQRVCKHIQTPCYKSYLTRVIELQLDKDMLQNLSQGNMFRVPRPGMGRGSFRRCRASKVWDLCRDDTRDFGFGWCEQRGTSDDLLHWWHSLSLDKNF